MARFMPRTELYLRSDIANTLRVLAMVAQSMSPCAYRQGFLNALGYVAASFDVPGLYGTPAVLDTGLADQEPLRYLTESSS